MGLKGQGLLWAAIRGILREGKGAGAPGKSMELIRRLEALNSEIAALDLEAALPPIIAGVRITSSGGGAEIKFAVRMPRVQGLSVVELPSERDDDPPSLRSRLAARPDILMRIPHGSIDVGPAPAAHTGACAGSWVVKFTEQTTSGWGPLLYDLAMEAAGAAGAALMPDRGIVSPDARGVWRKYDAARSDVEKVQLDVDLELSPKRSDVDYGEQITPDDPTDDCVQQSAADDEDVEGEPPPRNRRLRLPGSSRRARESAEDPTWSVGSWRRSPLSRAYRKTDGAVTAALDRAGLLWR